MKALVQRVKKAQVVIDKKVFSRIEKGLLVFLGVGKEDSYEKIVPFVRKIVNLRIFSDEQGKVNYPGLKARSLEELG